MVVASIGLYDLQKIYLQIYSSYYNIYTIMKNLMLFVDHRIEAHVQISFLTDH